MTLVIVAITGASLLLDVLWPTAAAGGASTVPFGAVMALGYSLGQGARLWDWVIATAAVLPVAVAVELSIDQVWALDSQSGSVRRLSGALAGWVGCLAGIWVSQLRFRRRARAVTSEEPISDVLER